MMNLTNLNKFYNHVIVKFTESGKEYTYRTREHFEVGDYAVVEVSGEFKIVRVQLWAPNVQELRGVTYRWIVAKVDVAAYMVRMREETEIEHELAVITEAAKERHAIKVMRDAFSGDEEYTARLNALIARAKAL
jgi:excinuclease UvrABC ATPase subunit